MENFEPKTEPKPEKSEARKKMEKKIRTMAAWGVISISSFPVFKALFKEITEPEYKPKAVIEYVEKQSGALKEIEKIELQQKIDYLREKFSDNIVSDLKYRTEINKEAASKPIKIKGFEKTGLSNEDFQELWSEKYYPKGWLDKEIEKVEYKTEEATGDAIPGYGRGKRTRYSAIHEAEQSGKSKITFFEPPPSETGHDLKGFTETLDWHFSHEASHANDWENEAELDFKQRVEFLHEVSENYFKEDAFRDSFGYIDSIKNKNPHKEQYYKVMEYWGKACQKYFTFPEFLEEDHPREFEMIDKYVKKEDSTFNPVEKHEQRNELIKEMVENK